MDQLILASLSHTHYWYEGGMLKVPAVEMHRSMANKFKYKYMFFHIDRNPKQLGGYCFLHTPSAISNKVEESRSE